MKLNGDLFNSGTIAGRKVLQLDAESKYIFNPHYLFLPGNLTVFSNSSAFRKIHKGPIKP
jgi:hypothetical protein